MKKSKKIVLIIVGIVVIVGIILFFVFNPTSSNDASTIYVQKVSDLTGTSYSENRYSGIVESQDSINFTLDSSRTLKEVFVQVGQEVNKDDALFSYDTSEASNQIQQKQLAIEAANNEITAQNNVISDLNTQINQGGDRTELQAQINDANYSIREQQNTIKATQQEIKQLQSQIDNATVKSTIHGIIKEVNQDGGTDNYGNTKPLISISEAGDYRVKGTLTEMGTIAEGSNVIVRSRIDESKIWKGTVSKVETEPQSDSTNSYGYTEDSSNTASKYPFYVSLESSDGLMLGQHVYIELDNGQSSVKDGIWLDQSFIAYDDSGNPYVWISKNNKLKKQSVEVGEIDEDLYTIEIVSGLSKDDYIAYNDDTYQEGMKTTSDVTIEE